ncbi:DUF1127 domain-containing protein [Agrobacterium sp. a22-2]|uniref:DUF1127 domain-containing protein n=1 Tax=Agrobacterium sp. a22-2 TaxID=2283840 RepID=UPI001FF042C7|nr:DUF1127 domain-containing protein [Agrobacterium sp. a22-2]
MDNLDYTLWACAVLLLCSVSAMMVIVRDLILIDGDEPESTSGLSNTMRLVFEEWPSKRRQRMALKELTDEALNDIGITRAQALCESNKPFWC